MYNEDKPNGWYWLNMAVSIVLIVVLSLSLLD